MIPEWTNAHILPPIRPEADGHSPDRSPYKTSLVQVVERFAISGERIAILDGLLSYREELRKVGLIDGFQWLNGSFMEHVEEREHRAPKDVDVVTFAHLPEGETQEALAKRARHLFDTKKTKENFKVDAYFVELGFPTTNAKVRSISYWYSMWSHRRDHLWKGFVQIELNNSDEEARCLLKQMREEQQHDKS